MTGLQNFDVDSPLGRMLFDCVSLTILLLSVSTGTVIGEAMGLDAVRWDSGFACLMIPGLAERLLLTLTEQLRVQRSCVQTRLQPQLNWPFNCTRPAVTGGSRSHDFGSLARSALGGVYMIRNHWSTPHSPGSVGSTGRGEQASERGRVHSVIGGPIAEIFKAVIDFSVNIGVTACSDYYDERMLLEIALNYLSKNAWFVWFWTAIMIEVEVRICMPFQLIWCCALTAGLTTPR
ncbi:hypothetical protein GGX14DRAFT_659864 [Mycena pura]|uniref:Uncharacterized protein n=1 Tax=Mycena pura TaxID=153505 RepID=A0AAD6V2K6_9AGAR|nr:hypothetical protein GGX14DRAFT_659864 [Mycena pura]